MATMNETVPVNAELFKPLREGIMGDRVESFIRPYAGYLLSARQKTSGSSIVYADAAGTQAVSVDPETGQVFPASFDASTNITNQIHTLNVGLTGGIGLTQNIGYGEVILNVRGGYGLTNIQKHLQDGKNQTGNLLISLGSVSYTHLTLPTNREV